MGSEQVYAVESSAAKQESEASNEPAEYSLSSMLKSLARGNRPSSPISNSHWGKGRQKMIMHIATDVATFSACVLLAYIAVMLVKGAVFTSTPNLAIQDVSLVAPIVFGLPLLFLIYVCRQKGHYSRFKGFWEEFGEFLQVSVAVAGISVALLFFTQENFSRLWLGLTWLLAIGAMPVARWLLKQWLMGRGKWLTPTIVIGAGSNAKESALAIESNVLMGFEVVGLIDIEQALEQALEQANPSDLPANVPVYDPHRCETREFPMANFVNGRISLQGNYKVEDCYIVLALDAEDYKTHSKCLEELATHRKNLSVIPPLRGLPLLGSEISPIFRHEVLHVRIRNNLASRTPRMIKRIFDVVLSGSALLVLSPLFVFLYFRISKDGGSPFYSQKRVGKKGKMFNCWKFRSMHRNADKLLKEILNNDEDLRKEFEATQKLKEDPRVTEIGKFIRKTSIDELPQLWNVFVGEMSLVGPRPVREDELELYGVQGKYYLETPPGITGLWQISGRNDVGYDTRVNLDTWYVRNWSLWYDITILAKTVSVVVFQKGAY
ncbi:undecaprenyl-phosphate galactose phosphotransferase WbaP [Halioxenophilus aromaticivorans]|uniref:Undecaprenyl-phosphate galactose phosphotransferase WbaP n=1 Tax=Halioxenophilus aromaticivorans TaxID=1306992 RepID=A0AAV3U0R2_9ALTE